MRSTPIVSLTPISDFPDAVLRDISVNVSTSDNEIEGRLVTLYFVIGMEINLSELSKTLSRYEEGRGRWRFLSHVRDEKVRLAIDLRNSSHSMEILERTLHLYANHPVRYIVGHSSDEHQKLRTNVLNRLKEIESESFEIKSFSKSIEVCALESDKVRNRRRNITFIVITGLILFSIQFILDTWL